MGIIRTVQHLSGPGSSLASETHKKPQIWRAIATGERGEIEVYREEGASVNFSKCIRVLIFIFLLPNTHKGFQGLKNGTEKRK